MAIYACSDFHGCIEFYKAIKNIIKPEDKVYFLGDAGDRGPAPWETIKAIARDPQFIYIKGNHEDMLAKAIFDCVDNDYMGGYRLLANNGGINTFEEAMLEEDPRGWANWLAKLPTHIEIINSQNEKIYLSHAGFTPWINKDTCSVILPDHKTFVWDRTHYFDRLTAAPWEDAIIVHGHTPIPHLWGDLNIPEEQQEKGALWYAGGRKLCIDTGAVWTGHAVLVNLDTWDEHILES